MKIPSYENQVSAGQINAAQPKQGQPLTAAFGGELGRGAANFAQGVNHLAASASHVANNLQAQEEENKRATERLNTRQRNLRKTAAILAWRKDNDELLNGKLDDTGKRIDGGLLTKQYGEAAGLASTYNEKVLGEDGLLKKHLATAPTEEERAEWALAFQQDYQNNFDIVAQYEFKQQKAQSTLLTKAFGQQQEGNAGAIRTVQEMRQNLDETYKVFDEDAAANGFPPEAIKSQRFDRAKLNVTASVKGAVLNGNLQAARTVLNGVKDDLRPTDYNALNHFIQEAQKAQEKGAKEQENGLYQWAFNMAEQDPQGLQQEVQAFRANPAAYQAAVIDRFGHPIEPKKLAEFFNWTQTNLLDNPNTSAGQQKRANFAEAETLYKGFNVTTKDGKTKIKNKDFDNAESLYGAVQTLSAGLKTGNFTKSDGEKVDQYRNELTRQLGKKIMDANYSHNFLWDASGEHMLQNEIALFAKGANLSEEEAAGIYVQARELAARKNVDLSKDYQDENAEKVEQIFSAARGLYFYRNYGVPMENTDAFIYNNKLVELQKKNKSQRAAYIKEVVGAAQKYKAEQLNGQNVNVSRDASGRVQGIYFNKGGN